MKDKPFIIGGKEYASRLIVGSGKYPSLPVMKDALTSSGSRMVTVALRRVDLKDRSPQSFYEAIPKGMTILPNTAACYTVEDALKTARIAREIVANDPPLIKLEILGDPKTLLPDTIGLLEATKVLVKEGFVVLPYTNDDPIIAKKLEDLGVAAVMPLASPIGSGMGLLNPYNIQLILETVTSVPVIVDAGVGTASDASLVMELGADGILMNTAIAESKNPAQMAQAMKLAVESGRLAYLAGRMPKRRIASPSSPPQ
ncbi:MAG: thiazole synthase [Elusimicrobia bacterium]|nr:thiazole synthase [Elusimicrobiota bacterium]MBI2915423.1 thiazole synthase [Elusimicrobiota bacterium]MBI4217563.1 thiazole synthase [Elusimicrobiota bacterium]